MCWKQHFADFAGHGGASSTSLLFGELFKWNQWKCLQQKCLIGVAHTDTTKASTL